MSNYNDNKDQNPIIINGNPDPIRNIKTIQKYLLASALCWGVSMFFAGIILSAAGAVCSFIALRKALQLEKQGSQYTEISKRLKILSMICLAACVLVFAATVISLIILFPVLLEAVESGDYSALGLGSSGNSSSSVW
ncbi:MAG: hypothetical protein ACOYD7_02455 [Raoultibacter sp.]|jgi:hypothetical protein